MIFGTGTVAEVLQFYLDVDSDYDVVAFTATDTRDAREFCGRPVVDFGAVTSEFPPSEHKMFVAVGYRRLNRLRAQFYDAVKTRGYELITYISSKATHWGDTVIGDNCCILESTTVEPFVNIGNDVFLWSGTHIGHHSSVGDHTFIASEVVIPGLTHIGRYCVLGVNATLRDGITVADECLIGAAATIMGDTERGAVYLGPRTEGETADRDRFLR